MDGASKGLLIIWVIPVLAERILLGAYYFPVEHPVQKNGVPKVPGWDLSTVISRGPDQSHKWGKIKRGY